MKCIYCGAELGHSEEKNIACPYCGGSFPNEAFSGGSAPKANHNEKEQQVTSYQGADVYEQNINSVLEITWSPALGLVVSGSGLLIDDSGYAITNTHVVCDDDDNPVKTVNVLIAGKKTKASVIRLGDNAGGRGNGVDLALIKLQSVPEKAKTVTFANFEDVRIGEQVFVIGNSLGDGTCITAGIVSDKQRKINGHTVLMTDCAINGGNSGGPIFNSKGEVIGVICSKRMKADGSATEGMNYAIPINITKDFIDGKHVAIKVSPENPRIKYKAAATKGPKCPKCGSTTTDVQNGIRYCYDCDYEW